MAQSQRPGSITAANNLIKEGFGYLRSGGYQVDGNFFKRGLSYLKPSRYTQKRKPVAALAAASTSYSSAMAQLDRVMKPADDAAPAEKQSYDNAVSGLEMLGSELQSYAKQAAKKIDDEAAKLVSRAERAGRQYERGRKILGVPYWRRPGAAKVEGKAVKAWQKVGESMSVTETNPTTGQPTGKTYFTQLQGDLKAIQLSLDNAKLFGDAEGQYLADVMADLVGYRQRLGEVLAKQRVTGEKRETAKTQKKEDKETRELEKEGARDFKKHMKAIKKHKW